MLDGRGANVVPPHQTPFRTQSSGVKVIATPFMQ